MNYIIALSLVFILLACEGNTQGKTELKTQLDSVSYSIGLDIGRNLKQQSVDVNPDVLARGIRDVVGGNAPLLTDEQVRATLAAFQQQMKVKQQEKLKEAGEKGKQEGEAFLVENKKEKGIITLPSGLQYKVLTMGAGPKLKAEQTVRVHYQGKLIDGTEFDSSYKRGEPAVFPVKGVIAGWTEALELMPVGSKWQLFIPSNLAYGESGAGQVIPRNATLIFDVELLSIQE